MPCFCMHCGAQLSRPDASFCAACGRPLDAVQGVLPQQTGHRTTLLSDACPQLIIQVPGQATRSVPLTKAQVTIGRESTCDADIASPVVSRQHARLEQKGGEYWITDLGSTNGTSVNGRWILQSQQLNDGDIVRIGDRRGNSVGLTFRSGTGYQQAGPTIALSTLTLGQPSTLIGRDPGSQVHLDHPTVSRRHARVDRMAPGHTIHDLNSSNGTFVNGQLVRGTRTLQDGDVVQIGPYKLVYDQVSLTQYTPCGNYSLDAIGLRREVSLAGPLSLPHLLGSNGRSTSKVILDDVTLSIRPREFVALVGSSGAGKSTLLKALSGFTPAEGQVLVNGDDLYVHFDAYRSILGYVPQDDILHGQLPVYGALTYAAQLRLPDADPQEIQERIKDVLDQVEMTEHADKQIDRLSGGQRKRVSIAAELLADPGLFFLDEPTSGLDPGLEKKMMYTMRRLADAGRTIVLVTHATANISQCTHIAFLAEGRLAYFGPSQEALTFFGASDFADIYARLSQPIDPVGNPLPAQLQPHYQRAMAASPDSPPSTAEVWANCFRSSPQYQRYVGSRIQATGTIQRPPGAPQRSVRQKGSAWRQFQVLTRRYFDLIRRDRMSLFILLAIMPLIGVLLLIMAQPKDLVGDSPPIIQIEIQEAIETKQANQDPDDPDERFQGSYVVVGSAQRLLFMLSLAANLLGIFAAAYEVVKEGTIYSRERMANLRIGPYLLSKMAVLALFAAVQCFMLLVVVSVKVRYPSKGTFLRAVVEMYVTLFLATLASIGMGLCISAIVRSANTVIYVILFVLFVQILFAGAIFDLPAVARPISYLTTTRWTLEALGSTVDMERLRSLGVSCVAFENQRFRDGVGGPDGPCVQGQLRQAADYTFNVRYRHTVAHLLSRWSVLLGFALAFGGLTYMVQKRKDVF